MNTSQLMYEAADRIIAEHQNWLEEAGPQDVQLIKDAERRLGFTLPPTYRRFVLEHGTIAFAGEEVYGIFPPIGANAVVPHAVLATLRQRERRGLPGNLLMIYNVGNGELLFLAVNGPEDVDCPVVSMTGNHMTNVVSYKVESPTFGEWWFALVEQAITDIYLEENAEID